MKRPKRSHLPTQFKLRDHHAAFIHAWHVMGKPRKNITRNRKYEITSFEVTLTYESGQQAKFQFSAIKGFSVTKTNEAPPTVRHTKDIRARLLLYREAALQHHLTDPLDFRSLGLLFASLSYEPGNTPPTSPHHPAA